MKAYNECIAHERGVRTMYTPPGNEIAKSRVLDDYGDDSGF